MAITAEMVKKLREQTGAGMMDCKKALGETNGDYEKAVTLLREKGIAVAAKRETRTASEGIIGSFITSDNSKGALTELNCETTFVAKTDEFIDLAQNLAKQAVETKCGDAAKLSDMPYIADNARKAGVVLTEIMGKVGEKMAFKRAAFLDTDGKGLIGSYIHMGGQIGVLVQLNTEAKSDNVLQLAKDIAMHISWSNPDYMKREDIPQDALDKEREVHKQWAIKEGKPEKIIDRIVDGRMKDFYSKVCLLEQPFVKDEEKTIKGYINEVAKAVGSEISIAGYVRFRVGETSVDA